MCLKVRHGVHPGRPAPCRYSRQRRVMPVTGTETTQMYTKDGESYFIVDAHVALWDARPENQRNIHGKQFIDCFYDYHRNLSPESEVWPYEEYLYQGGERLMKDLFDRRVRRPRDLPAGLPRRVLPHGVRPVRGGVGARQGAPGQADLQPQLRPAQRRAGLEQLRADAERFGLRGSSSTPPSGTASPAAGSSTTRGRTATSRPAASSASPTSTSTRARRSGRWTGTRSTSPTSTTSPRTSPT